MVLGNALRHILYLRNSVVICVCGAVDRVIVGLLGAIGLSLVCGTAQPLLKNPLCLLDGILEGLFRLVHQIEALL